MEGSKFAEGRKYEGVVTTVGFNRLDGIWIPAEVKVEGQTMWPGHAESVGASHIKLREFLIDPDHEALRSFATDDFVEGSRVLCVENGKRVPGWFVWQDGKPVPADR